jgi:hypothetical protein
MHGSMHPLTHLKEIAIYRLIDHAQPCRYDGLMDPFEAVRGWLSLMLDICVRT